MKFSQYAFLLFIFFISCKNHEASDVSESTSDTIEVSSDDAVSIQKTFLLNPEDFNKQITNNNSIQLIDVRTPSEFSEGYIAGSKNIDFNNSEFASNIENLRKDQAVYLYCRSGGRSGKATKMLADLGFSEVYDLDGGIIAWNAAQLPLEK